MAYYANNLFEGSIKANDEKVILVSELRAYLIETQGYSKSTETLKEYMRRGLLIPGTEIRARLEAVRDTSGYLRTSVEAWNRFSKRITGHEVSLSQAQAEEDRAHYESAECQLALKDAR